MDALDTRYSKNLIEDQIKVFHQSENNFFSGQNNVFNKKPTKIGGMFRSVVQEELT